MNLQDKPQCYSYHEHTADILIKAYGDSFEKAVENALLGISNTMHSKKDIPTQTHEFEIQANRNDMLVYKVLSEAISYFDAHSCACIEANVTIQRDKVMVTLQTQQTTDGYNPIKSMTYHQLEITHEQTNWTITFVVDI
ncbi:MAG: SHS2 domain-containing protein [Candidatus Woesearchaeota archaeon]|jgi:SHS2 domain-containing protein